MFNDGEPLYASTLLLCKVPYRAPSCEYFPPPDSILSQHAIVCYCACCDVVADAGNLLMHVKVLVLQCPVWKFEISSSKLVPQDSLGVLYMETVAIGVVGGSGEVKVEKSDQWGEAQPCHSNSQSSAVL